MRLVTDIRDQRRVADGLQPAVGAIVGVASTVIGGLGDVIQALVACEKSWTTRTSPAKRERSLTQNSTPLMYYSVDAFKDARLDPDQPPATWQELCDAARKLTQRDGGSVSRWGSMMPGTYDYLSWLTSGLAMSNGGQLYNTGCNGKVYYTQPSTIGAVKLLDELAHKAKAMPEGVTDANSVPIAFFQGAGNAGIAGGGEAIRYVIDDFPVRIVMLETLVPGQS